MLYICLVPGSWLHSTSSSMLKSYLQFVMVVLRKKLETKIAWTEWICLQSKPSQQHIETV